MRDIMENGMTLLSICLEEMSHNVVRDGEDSNLLRLYTNHITLDQKKVMVPSWRWENSWSCQITWQKLEIDRFT